MRTKNSLINIAVSFVSYFVLMITTFVVRSVFSKQLGLEIVGIDGLFLNVISMLAIVELGIGTGMVYKLYKPIAENDNQKIAVILNFYKKTYTIIGLIVLLLGLGTSTFVHIFVKEDYSKLWLGFIFLFYVFDVLSSYLYAHKRALFTADQKNFVNNIAHLICQVLACALQLVVLYVFHSFVLYLCIKVICRILENIFISLTFNRKYAYIDLSTKEKMDSEEQKGVFQNMKALLMHKIAGFSLKSSSNMIVSYFVNVKTVGIYSNYNLIINALTNLSVYFFDGILASFGNLLNTSSHEKMVDKFNTLYFLNYMIMSFFCVTTFVVITPFCEFCFGVESTFPIFTTLLIVINLYIYGMRQCIFMVRSSTGVYQQDRWFAILEAVLNIGLGLLLVQKYKLNGVLMANIISTLLVPFWTQPIIVYKSILKKKIRDYYLRYLLFAGLTIGGGLLVYWLCGLVATDNLLVRVISNVLIATIVINGLNVLLFCRTKSFQYLWNTIKELFKMLTGKKVKQ